MLIILLQYFYAQNNEKNQCFFFIPINFFDYFVYKSIEVR